MHLTGLANLKEFRLARKGQAALSDSVLDFCPDYDASDRFGVVSPHFEDGIFSAGYAVIALVLGFYSRNPVVEGCNYPPFFCFLEQPDLVPSVITTAGVTVGPFDVWRFLDFWPEKKWRGVNADVMDILRQVRDAQIDYLFWPDSYLLAGSTRAPSAIVDEVKALIADSALKTIYLYGDRSDGFRILVEDNVEAIILRSINNMPLDDAERVKLTAVRRKQCRHEGQHCFQSFEAVMKDEFLSRL